jgi:hypothetical protein
LSDEVKKALPKSWQIIREIYLKDLEGDGQSI